ncbi:MAG: response regulator [Candidatus Binatus sp.]|uniref:response regulator transcription factor n=1 Tax=Candidatus Binatus sp. TaxID=2811406 RepID=UPI00272064AF|nr:response regulator [Candidatus Binatus sp.]MDO8432753.1 response regulator [Candidatus Binatus sp.]
MGAKILLVDDERDLVDAYVRLFQRAGLRCVGAFDAAAAIPLIDSENPDLIITDLSLADVSGLEVVRHARARSVSTPIIVMTGHNTPEITASAMAAGANVCLLKPVSIVELNRVVRNLLDRII